AKPPLSSPALPRPHQANHRKRSQQQTSSSSSHPHPGPSSILVSDTTMTPWGGLALSESSFTSIPLPPPPRPPPLPPPPAPQPTPSTPYRDRHNEDEDVSSSSFNSPSPPGAVPQDSATGRWRGQRVACEAEVVAPAAFASPPRLAPLRPVTNLSFSRSFTFSFFELPLHQSPRCRAERIRNLMLLLKQIHY
ncbi:hypothetical protein F7725_000442, partial [Dissostichus mawsoni]